GELTLRQLDLGTPNKKGAAKVRASANADLPDVEVKQTRTGTSVTFDAPITLHAGDEIEITLRNE
ncbi:MAG TPA: hypothetical protein VGK81_09985, partial [Anaerolineae bacterium]